MNGDLASKGARSRTGSAIMLASGHNTPVDEIV